MKFQLCTGASFRRRGLVATTNFETLAGPRQHFCFHCGFVLKLMHWHWCCSPSSFTATEGAYRSSDDPVSNAGRLGAAMGQWD